MQTEMVEGVQVLECGALQPEGTELAPGNPSWRDTVRYIQDPVGFCRDHSALYGPIFRAHVFGKNTIMIGESAAAKMTFNGDQKYTEIALPGPTMDMFGEESLFQRPDLHGVRKRALNHHLGAMVLDRYLPRIEAGIERGLNTWQDGAVDIYPAVEEISFDTLCSLMLGVDPTDPKAFDGLPIGNAADLKKIYGRYFNGFYGLTRWNVPWTVYGRGRAARARLLEFMRAVIARRRAAENEHADQDFVGSLLAQQGEGNEVFTDSFIENQCLLQLWGAHFEITAMLASLVYQLGQHPEVRSQIREECGALETADGVTLKALRELPYTLACIKESLRLLPPTSTANRKLTRPVVLDGMFYPEGTALIVEPRIAHFREEYFSNPDAFEPDRFLAPRSEGGRYSYIPFGGGVHVCLGMQMSLAFGQVFLRCLSARADWTAESEADFVQFPMRHPKAGTLVDVSFRQSQQSKKGQAALAS